MTSARPTAKRLVQHLAWALPAVVLVWHVSRYAFVTDDAFISFVYARNLAEHGELVFNLGQPVEGYSNFSWTVLLALGIALGIAPEIASQVLGVVFAVGTLAVVARLSRRLVSARPGPWDAVAPLLLATSSGFACWSSGGLETQMFTFLVTASLLAYTEAMERAGRMLACGALLALACLTRPEGLLILALVGAHRVGVLGAWRRWPTRADWLAAGLVLLVVGAHLAWRWHYYGHPLPNTYYVKAAGDAPPGYDAALWSAGRHYLWRFAVDSGALVAAPLWLLGALGSPRHVRARIGLLALAVAAAYSLYTASVGGDFMGLYRFVMPLWVLAAVFAAVGLRRLSAWLPALPRRPLVIAVAVSLVVLAHAAFQARLTARATTWGNFASDQGIDTPAYLEAYTLDRGRIGQHMRDCFEPGDFSIVGGAGAQPYYGRMRSVDVFGLVSELIAHRVPPTRPRAGHNKWAPDDLLAELDPTFVFSCYSIHREPDRPQLNCSPGFWLRRGYERVTLHIPGLRQQGEYYTFLAKRDRRFECPGKVSRSTGP